MTWYLEGAFWKYTGGGVPWHIKKTILGTDVAQKRLLGSLFINYLYFFLST